MLISRKSYCIPLMYYITIFCVFIGYDVVIENKKETCARKYQLYVKPNHNKEKCQEKCDDNSECMFFFNTDNGWCTLYKECEEKRIPGLPGTTYQKNQGI